MLISLIGLLFPLLTGAPSQHAKPPQKQAVKKPVSAAAVPHYKSAAVKTLVGRSIHRYENLSNVAYTALSKSSQSSVWIAGSSLRERQAGCDWTYANGYLTIKDLRHGKSYRGKTKGNRVAGYLSQIGVMVEPTVQMKLLKKNRVGALVQPGFYVRSVGTVKVGTASCTAVEILGPTIKIEALIRQRDFLLASVSSEALDGSGAAVAKADRQYVYTSLGKVLPASTFKLQLGSSKPLSLKSMPNAPKKVAYKAAP